mgnify:CR=1 FL=1|tara:strand:- start:93950 stop:94234 length:285 start_codon:yes stop_codon:yes gene_type:complete
MAYYNTTAETTEQSKEYNLSNMKQDEIVLAVAKNLEKPFSASMILFHFPKLNTPITSIRRSIHTLHHKLNTIEPTGKKVEGLFGRPELQYRILK